MPILLADDLQTALDAGLRIHSLIARINVGDELYPCRDTGNSYLYWVFYKKPASAHWRRCLDIFLESYAAGRVLVAHFLDEIRFNDPRSARYGTIGKATASDVLLSVGDDLVNCCEKRREDDGDWREHVSRDMTFPSPVKLQWSEIAAGVESEFLRLAAKRASQPTANVAQQNDERSIARNIRPRWEKRTGRLFLGEVVVRKLQIGKAQNAVLILDELERLRWPRDMDDPLPGKGHTKRRLSDTAASLNNGLSHVRFAVNGSVISWSRLDLS
jgi:hypothetical protein